MSGTSRGAIPAHPGAMRRAPSLLETAEAAARALPKSGRPPRQPQSASSVSAPPSLSGPGN